MISFNKINSKYIAENLSRAHVLGIGGSPRKGGNSDLLLKSILQGVNDTEVNSDVAKLRNFQFQPCIGCEKCRKDKICTGLMDGMSLLYPKIIDARGLVLVSPTHNYNITAIMKAFIDRLYCFYNFDNKNRPGQWSSQLNNQGRKAVYNMDTTRELIGRLKISPALRRICGWEKISDIPHESSFSRAFKEFSESGLTQVVHSRLIKQYMGELT